MSTFRYINMHKELKDQIKKFLRDFLFWISYFSFGIGFRRIGNRVDGRVEIFIWKLLNFLLNLNIKSLKKKDPLKFKWGKIPPKTTHPRPFDVKQIEIQMKIYFPKCLFSRINRNIKSRSFSAFIFFHPFKYI